MVTRIAVVLTSAALTVCPFRSLAEENTNEHSATMSKSMTHDQAVEATRAKHSSKARKGLSHSEAMAKGMTHDQAVSATQGSSNRSKATAHAKKMSEGMTHDEAAGQSSK